MPKTLLELIWDHGKGDEQLELTEEMIEKLLVNDKGAQIINEIIMLDDMITAYTDCAEGKESFHYQHWKLFERHQELLTDKAAKFSSKNYSLWTPIDEPALIKIYKELLKKDYEPPANFKKIMLHLRAFAVFYHTIIKSLDNISIYTFQILDFNLMQLRCIANLTMGRLHEHAAKEGERLYNIKKTKTAGKEERKSAIIYEFNQLTKKNFSSRRSLCIHIQKKLEKKGTEAPCWETIRNFLREEGKI